jgi:hypothetical protein
VVGTVAEAYPRFEKWGDNNIHGERGARAYIGKLGALTQLGPGTKPLVGGQGASPPEAYEISAT